MSALAKPRLTPEEYLARERKAEFKSEYFAGETFAMAGARLPHIVIATNLVRRLGNQLESRPCQILSNDMRVKVSATGLYTYPDVIVVCGKPRLEDEKEDTLLNPTVLIEVLSESTEAYDRGRKFLHYQSIESLREYVLVAQDECRVERFERQRDDTWVYWSANRMEDTLKLPAIGCELPLAEIYDKVQFPDERRSAT